MTKRKCTFNSDFESIDGVKRSKKGDGYFYCTYCQDDYNLESMGKAAIAQHQEKTKHKDAMRRKRQNQTLNQFMATTSTPTSDDLKAAAAEGCWAYHVVRHHQSFASTDCLSSGLFKSMFPDSNVAKKYASAQHKTAAIITSVLAPHALKSLLEELGTQPFSIAIDASNHAEKKLFPLIIRFYNAKNGLRTRLLDMESLPGETSNQIFEWITSILERHGLDFENLIAFCADNAPTNFGKPDQLREGRMQRFIFSFDFLKTTLKLQAHILHNAAKKAAEQLSFDIEAISFKLSSYFKQSTQRHEEFRAICEQFETGVLTLPTHAPTRWTTLAKIIDKILLKWEPLKQLFSEPGKPRMLREFFQSDLSEPICNFLQSVLKLFEGPILSLQRDDLFLPDLLDVMADFKAKIEERLRKKFFGAMTLLRRLSPDQSAALQAEFCLFYQTVIDYLENWFQLQCMPKQIYWLNLRDRDVDYEREVLPLAEQICPEVAQSDELFDEVAQLNAVLKKIPEDNFFEIKAEEKWNRIFRAPSATEHYKNLYRLVSAVFSIPVSNAFVERVFSLANVQWTKERNLLRVETVKALLLVQVNFDQNCKEMYEMLSGSKKLLKAIVSGEKYN